MFIDFDIPDIKMNNKDIKPKLDDDLHEKNNHSD